MGVKGLTSVEGGMRHASIEGGMGHVSVGRGIGHAGVGGGKGSGMSLGEKGVPLAKEAPLGVPTWEGCIGKDQELRTSTLSDWGELHGLGHAIPIRA